MYFFGINVKIINVGRVITLDNKDEKEIKKVTRKKKENNENEINKLKNQLNLLDNNSKIKLKKN